MEEDSFIAEPQDVEEQQTISQATPGAPKAGIKKKRVISPEAKEKMLENLKRAREAKAINRSNVTKYPKEKRQRAKEMYEEDVNSIAEEKARKLAEKMLQEKKTQRELEMLRAFKKSQETTNEPEPKKPKAKKTQVKTKKPKKQTPIQEEESQQDDYQQYDQYDQYPQSRYNWSDYLD
ncbi:hypothetical protein HK097_007659 [Rhizophlyctis rosea]|uniref:Uncharacterized protein n=1 Tax=Rhizophlyctis rosea TaxID=64517 RepID=A0AAD5X241_9FUNG|nr:hypothetical protein HK097_007659 [Rhizophlyctis rosea]